MSDGFRTGGILFACATVLATLAVCTSARCAADGPPFNAVYSREFSTEGFDNLCLTPFGKGATSLVRESADGLLVSLPPAVEVLAVGFATRFVIRGDFQITTAYEIRKQSGSRADPGGGPSIYLSTADDIAAELSRIQTPQGENVHSTFTRTVVDGNPRKSARRFVTDVVKGQMRVRRTGNKLHFEVRPDWSDGPFETIDKRDFSSSDLTLLRLAVKRRDPKDAVQVVFQDVEVGADELPELPSAESRSKHLYRPSYHPPVRVIRRLTPMLLLTAAGGVLALGALWLHKRRT